VKARPGYERLAREIPLERLIELSEKFAELQATPGWGELMELLKLGKGNIETYLRSGRTLEQADYARLHGFLFGMEQPLEAIQAVTRAREAKEAEVAENARREAELEGAQA
jgi:hypothetical protein